MSGREVWCMPHVEGEGEGEKLRGKGAYVHVHGGHIRDKVRADLEE